MFFDPLERFRAPGGFRILRFALDVSFLAVVGVVWASVGVLRFSAIAPVPAAGFVQSFFFKHLFELGTIDASFFELAVRVRFGFGDEVRRVVINRVDFFRVKAEPLAALVNFWVLVDLFHVQSVLRPRAPDVVSIRDAVFIPVGFR